MKVSYFQSASCILLCKLGNDNGSRFLQLDGRDGNRTLWVQRYCICTGFVGLNLWCHFRSQHLTEDLHHQTCEKVYESFWSAVFYFLVRSSGENRQNCGASTSGSVDWPPPTVTGRRHHHRLSLPQKAQWLPLLMPFVVESLSLFLPPLFFFSRSLSPSLYPLSFFFLFYITFFFFSLRSPTLLPYVIESYSNSLVRVCTTSANQKKWGGKNEGRCIADREGAVSWQKRGLILFFFVFLLLSERKTNDFVSLFCLSPSPSPLCLSVSLFLFLSLIKGEKTFKCFFYLSIKTLLFKSMLNDGNKWGCWSDLLRRWWGGWWLEDYNV